MYQDDHTKATKPVTSDKTALANLQVTSWIYSKLFCFFLSSICHMQQHKTTFGTMILQSSLLENKGTDSQKQ